MPSYDAVVTSGDKTAVILDIGTAYTKCGFAGDTGPRFIIPTSIQLEKTEVIVQVHSIVQEDELYNALVQLIHQIFFRKLLVNPKDRRIVVVESLMSQTKFRNVLAKVLFKQYEVASVAFATSHVVALLTLGIPSGLVFDCGYSETLVVPVYEGTPILSACQVLPVAGKSIHQYMDELLRETATLKVGRNSDVPLSTIMNSVEESVLEDIKVRTCFVTKLSRAKELAASMMPNSTTSAPAPPPDCDYPLDGNKLLHIHGSLREKACEVLFERDADELSTVMLILNALVKCPIDTRKVLSENIVIMGGTTMMPGFKHRLLSELQDLVVSPRYKDDLGIRSFKFHTPPALENYVAWLGGAIYGALEVLGSRSLSREQYLLGSPLPDWCVIQNFDESSTVPAK